MRIEEWLPRFLTDHIKRFPGMTWPGLGTDPFLDMAKVWRHNLVTNGVTAEVALEASYSLAGIEHFQADHLPKFLKICGEIARRDASTFSSVEADPLKAASRASADCFDCGGSGWAVRFIHPEIHGRLNNANGDPVPVGMSVALPCGCDLGREMARIHGYRLTVADYPTLRLRLVGVDPEERWDNCYRYRPEAPEPEVVEACPVAPAPDLAEAIPDPVIDRERLRRTPEPAYAAVAEEIHIPEDAAADGWY